MSNSPFDKFINKEAKGAKKKEALRQEKRKGKADARALGEELRKKKLDKKRGIVSPEAIVKNARNLPKHRETAKPPEENGKKKRFNKKALLQDPNSFKPQTTDLAPDPDQPVSDTLMPLNKFVAHAGICGRREAAELIRQGLVTVNGDKVVEPGFKVRGNEDVKVKGKKIFLQRNLVYILLNKPKDYITTAKDPEGRKTVFDLIKGATKERVYSVGRLDRNTTGVLLLTNDGELAQKLTHPSYQIKKIYEVKLDKPVTKKDYDAIVTGITLEDGFVKADSLAYDEKDKSILGIEIHSGRNRIVRRIFEHLGYDVKNLDRVMFANLTKKNVDRGTWRMLQPKEVRLLKFMNQSFLKKEA
jgi:23S rRNA pseudouridine2605 synthase